jgi:hypothetical protein
VNLGFNGLLGVMLSAIAPTAPELPALWQSLIAARGIKLPQVESNRQDNSLQGWPWVPGTFSWVEPTALCLLALKCGRPRPPGSAPIIAEADRLLLDRVCSTGGWNYGTSNVMGQSLDAHTPPTALALLALGDRGNDEPVKRSLQFLATTRLDERSGLALGLTCICLGRFGVPTDDVVDALSEAWKRSSFIGNLHVTAVVLYALAARSSGYQAFHV